MKCYSFFLLLLIIGCSTPKPGNEPVQQLAIKENLNPEYATGFSLDSVENGYLLEVLEPYAGADETIKYFLSANTGNDSLINGVKTIHIPVESIICTSTSHIPLLDYLGEAHSLKGFPNTDYISNKNVRNLIENGHVSEVGNADQLNLEKVMETSPDLIMAYSVNDLEKMERLEQYGQKVLINSDYLEQHPLGRAEWIKVAGILFGKKEKADSIFSVVKTEYEKYSTLNDGPCVFSGSVYGDSWFMPGGRNYGARLLQDAGYRYLYEADSTTGFLNLSFERVFEKGINCEFWIGPAPFPTLEDLGKADNRYRSFNSFQHGNVYTYDNRIGPTGGNEYLEEGYLRPDLILKDLVFIRDSTAIPGHELYFYRKLR